MAEKGHVLPVGVDGLLSVGRFERIESSERGSQVIVSRARWDGNRFETSYLYDSCDRETGERTAIDEALGKLSAGTLVALRVKGKVAKSGRSVWFLAGDAIPLTVSG